MLKKIKIELLPLDTADDLVVAHVMVPLSRALTAATLFLVLSHSLELFWQGQAVSAYTKQLIVAYMLLMAGMLILLQQKINYCKQVFYQREEAVQYERLKLYTEQVEKLYQKVRGFKHDYRNMLISLDETIRTGDIRQVRHLYDDILISANVSLQEGENIDDLSQIENAALKSILYWKIVEARQDGVLVRLEIKDRIGDVGMETLDFVRVLSILLDNAIEAAKESLSPEVSLALVRQEDLYILYVKNSIRDRRISIPQLFEENYSTKGPGRGTGLYSLRRILDGYPQISLETSLLADSLTQVVYIGA